MLNIIIQNINQFLMIDSLMIHIIRTNIEFTQVSLRVYVLRNESRNSIFVKIICVNLGSFLWKNWIINKF